MRSAHARQPAGYDFAALRNESLQQAHVLVIDIVNLLDAKFAYLLAPEKLPASSVAAPSRPTVRSVAAIAAPCWWARTARCASLVCFVSHSSPQCLRLDISAFLKSVVLFLCSHRRVFRFGGRRGFNRRTLHARRADLADLLQPLLLLIHADRDELQNLFRDPHTPFQLMNGLAIGLQREQHVEPFLELLHVISQPSFAPFIKALHLGPGVGCVRLERGEELVCLLFLQVRPHNKHYLVGTLHSFLHLRPCFA